VTRDRTALLDNVLAQPLIDIWGVPMLQLGRW
jgi:hypothetical protein